MINFLKRKPQTELQLQEARLQALTEKVRLKEIANANAAAASRLEALESRGLPFWEPELCSHEQNRPEPVKTYHPLYIYETSAVGYPFEPKLTYEQDPLFGWGVNPFHNYLDQNVAINAFPRELYPDRPSTLRTQIAQDAIRFESRIFFERLPQYSGIIGHLRNYLIGSGMTIDVVSDTDNELAKDLCEYLDEFAKYENNHLHKRIWDSVLNLYRDGEDAIRIYPGKEYPIVRSIDVSTIRGPHNEITGPWAYGVLTSWPRDWEDVKADHLWYSDNTH